MKSKTTCVALTLAFAFAAGMRADDFAEKGRAIYKTHRQSVVIVQLVVKSKMSVGGMGTRSSEARQDITGTVIDPAGLTVVSLSALDPAQIVNFMSSGSEEDSKFRIETELTDLKILLDDGTEASAEVVLRDRDLDLAFLRPKIKVDSAVTPVDLASPGKAQILDQVVALNRLGNAAGRAYAASAERISAIIERPRLFYIPETSQTLTSLGAPAFTLDGKFLGVFVMRAVKGGGSGGTSANQKDNIAGIIVPADDVLKAAKQAPAAAK